MRPALVCILIVCFATAAFATENPDIRIFLDADPPNRVSRVDPDPTTIFEVYIVLDRFSPCGAGTRGLGFLFDRTFDGFKLGQTSMLGGLDFGDVEFDGWMIAAGAECVYPDPENGIVVVGRVDYLYLGGPGALTLHPHPGIGRNTLDCDFMEDDQYCIGGHLGVWQDPPPGEDCIYYSHVVTNPNVGIAMHVDSAGHDCSYNIPDCNLINTYWPTTGELINVFVIVCMHENGFNAVEYSMDWPPEWSLYGWESCASYDSDFFFFRGDGIRQCFSLVPPGQPKVVGVLTLLPTTPGRVYVWTHPMTGVAAVYKGTAFDEVLPWDTYGNGRAGWVDVVSGPGCNPCFCVNPDPCWPDQGTEVSETVWEGSWGAIKAMYK